MEKPVVGNNYYHIVCDALPHFADHLQCPPANEQPFTVYAHGHLHIKIFTELGVPIKHRREAPETAVVLNAYATDSRRKTLAIRNHVMAIAGAHWPDTGDARPYVVYATRSQARCRNIDNEAELLDAIRAVANCEVRVVAFETMSLCEQARVAAGASGIIGPHGAGLTNALFLKPGSFVIEIMPEHFVFKCFNRVANIAGLRFTSLMATSAGRPTNGGHAVRDVLHMTVDIPAVVEAIQKYTT